VTYKLRNTIALGVVWLIITLLGLSLWAYWQPRQIKKINKETQAINKQLEDLPGING